MQKEKQQRVNNPLNKEEEYVIDLNTLPMAELAGHAWRQIGIYLHCQSCNFHHGFCPTDDFGNPLLTRYQLYGIDDKGIPLLRKVPVKN